MWVQDRVPGAQESVGVLLLGAETGGSRQGAVGQGVLVAPVHEKQGGLRQAPPGACTIETVLWWCEKNGSALRTSSERVVDVRDLAGVEQFGHTDVRRRITEPGGLGQVIDGHGHRCFPFWRP